MEVAVSGLSTVWLNLYSASNHSSSCEYLPAGKMFHPAPK